MKTFRQVANKTIMGLQSKVCALWDLQSTSRKGKVTFLWNLGFCRHQFVSFQELLACCAFVYRIGTILLAAWLWSLGQFDADAAEKARRLPVSSRRLTSGPCHQADVRWSARGTEYVLPGQAWQHPCLFRWRQRAIRHECRWLTAGEVEFHV